MNLALTEPLPLTQHDLFSLEECDDLSERVLSLRSAWTRRGQDFYSLGTAAYLDATADRTAYLEAARRTNETLRAGFDDTYEILCEFFEDLLGDPVELTGELALPGFHVFEYDGSPRGGAEEVAGRAHFDLQFMSALPVDVPLTGTMSFTVTVEEPSGGAALEVWPLRYSEVNTIAGSVQDYARATPSRRVVYAIGGVTVHDGQVLHAIGASGDPRPRGRRITMQGHAARIDDVWTLYW